jgi:hypothetical protein
VNSKKSIANSCRYRAREYETEDGPWDPISGGASALLGTIASLTMGVADFPLEIFKAVKTKQAAAKEEKASKHSSSGENTPASASRSQSQLDLALDEKSDHADGSSLHTSTSVPSGKTSYESADQSTERTSMIGTAMTSTTSLESVHRTGSNSLKQALRGTLSRSRSNSRDRKPGSRSQSKERGHGRSGSPMGHNKKTFDPSKLTLDNAIGAGKGVQRIVGAGMKSPMDFTLGIARGFHNAPKLYGDDTVRPQEKVTDFQSGLKAAGKVNHSSSRSMT